MNKVAILGLSLLVGACGQEGGSSERAERTGLEITSHTAKTLAGTFDDGVSRLSFTGSEVAANVVRLEVVTGTHTFAVDMDYGTGEMRATGETVAFTQQEVDAFAALDVELSLFFGEEMTPVERVMTGWTSIMTEAVPGVVWQDVSSVSTRAWEDISPENYCRTLYGTCGNPYKMTGKNSPNCKGRCGAGCGSARSGGSNRWTMDCAEHDYVIGPFGDTVDDAVSAASQWSSGDGEWCAGNCGCNDGC